MPTVKNDWSGTPYVERWYGKDYGSVETHDVSWGGLGEATKVSVPADGLYGALGGRTTMDPRDQGNDSVSGADMGGYETGSSDHSTGEPSSCVAGIIGCVVGLTILFILMIPVFSWARRMDEKMRTRRWRMSYPYRNAPSANPKPKGTTSKGPYWLVEGDRILKIDENGNQTGEMSVDEAAALMNPPKKTPKGRHWLIEGNRILEIDENGNPTGEEMSMDEATKRWGKKTQTTNNKGGARSP